ncbi:MAG: indole-3-glycerol-phosphate synthase, partial [Acidobacteria bacterium]|nr:indole-3-glycerol-phosphate synthase [Acidobacteriota bacterium]
AARAASPPRDLRAALAVPGVSLIAEVKRASPSAGTFPEVDPASQAAAYERGGAAAVSVLTERDHLGGSLEDMAAVRGAVGIPVLRKDFLCDPLHVWEARAAGADAVLLIVAALSQTELVALMDTADALEMSALVEAHCAAEVDRAVAAGSRIVGINARDLGTLRVDLGVVRELRPRVPDGVLVVGESGVATRADVEALAAAGVDAVLVGEALMRAPDPAAKVRELLGREEE